ncbi:MAG: hypothetical protein U1E76_21720 [Planctomycetota bacterium]
MLTFSKSWLRPASPGVGVLDELGELAVFAVGNDLASDFSKARGCRPVLDEFELPFAVVTAARWQLICLSASCS